MELTDRQKLNIANGLTKNGYAHLNFGAPSRVNLYICPTCKHVNKVVKNWHGPTPRGGFYCNGKDCKQVIGF
jgi:hypothetical protein